MKTVLALACLLQALPFLRMDYERLPDLQSPRSAHGFVTDGRDLFVFGGHTTGFIPLATAECFRDGEWQTLEMIYPHDGGLLAPLPDGRWLLGGGSEKEFGIGQSFGVEIFDPSTRRFSPLTILDRPRAYASAAMLDSGRLIVSGNWYADDGIAAYTREEGFRTINPTAEARRSPYILPLKDGNALIFGGMGNHGESTKGLVDQLDGEPFSVPLLESWTVLNYYVNVSPPVPVETDTWLLAALSKQDGAPGIIMVRGCSFSLLQTDVPIPRTGVSACDIEYSHALLIDSERSCAWLSGIDTGRRLYLVKLDYAQALKGGKAQVSLYFADNPDGGFPKEMGLALLPDGSIAAVGGFMTDNFQPVGTAWIFHPLGLPVVEGGHRFLSFALAVIGLLAVAAAFILIRRRRRLLLQDAPSQNNMMIQIRTALEEKQMFRVHGLQVVDLAKELGTNTTYISTCINKETGASFNDLVNEYRIRYALDLLSDNPSMPVTQLADLSGFSSYSSFIRSFKRITGKTPSEYISGM